MLALFQTHVKHIFLFCLTAKSNFILTKRGLHIADKEKDLEPCRVVQRRAEDIPTHISQGRILRGRNRSHFLRRT